MDGVEGRVWMGWRVECGWGGGVECGRGGCVERVWMGWRGRVWKGWMCGESVDGVEG